MPELGFTQRESDVYIRFDRLLQTPHAWKRRWQFNFERLCIAQKLTIFSVFRLTLSDFFPIKFAAKQR